MTPPTHTHVLKLPNHSITLRITEEPKRILIQFTMDPPEKVAKITIQKMQEWALPILAKYDSDPRPNVMENTYTGEVSTTFGDANNAFTIITPPKRKQ